MYVTHNMQDSTDARFLQDRKDECYRIEVMYATHIAQDIAGVCYTELAG